MDNFKVDVTSESYDVFVRAITMAFADDRARDMVEVNGVLKFLNSEGMPVALPADVAVHVAWEWLQHAKYPKQPDIDGDVTKGFRVYRNKMEGDWREVCAIEPTWAIHHK